MHFADDFHVFAVEWEPKTVRFFVDQELYATFTPARLPAGMKWVFDHPFFIILNVAVGGDWPGLRRSYYISADDARGLRARIQGNPVRFATRSQSVFCRGAENRRSALREKTVTLRKSSGDVRGGGFVIGLGC